MSNSDDKNTKQSEDADVAGDLSDNTVTPPVEEVVEEQSESDKVKSEYQELENKYKRALADYQNLEKRVAEGRAELAAWATSQMVVKMLPVMDHFDKAMQGVSEDEKKSGWFKGVEMSIKQLRQVLKDEGLEQIEADGRFDPALHEAVDTKEGEDDKILEVVEKGYRLGGKVVKPVKVVVGRKG